MSFQQFLDSFVPTIEQKSRDLNLAIWELETTGSAEAAKLKAKLDTEFRLLFNDRATYERLLAWDKEISLSDPLLKRQLNILIRLFKPNLIPKAILEKITEQEATLSLLYSNFRPQVHGKLYTENEIRKILKGTTDLTMRQEVWEASKQIGQVLAPHTLNLVRIRNEAAKSLGYQDYFSMQLDLQEVNEDWLFAMLDRVEKRSEVSYSAILTKINTHLAERFSISPDRCYPWMWSDPFCQEDPLEAHNLDSLVQGLDIIEAAQIWYHSMDLNVEQILQRSDNFERRGKNQHAFCINIDRQKDVRILNNVEPTMKWLETVLHELGHAVYELGFSDSLPWLLKEPPHMITTEAMALLAGRQAFRTYSLHKLVGHLDAKSVELAEQSIRRRQLIFSRWVLVMTYFEKELYQNPEQDLQSLWWNLVDRFQHIESSNRADQCDWAAKYHISLSPVYYFSYLLGELFASSLEKKLSPLPSKEAAHFLTSQVFSLGNRMPWNELIQQATGKELSEEDWIAQFATVE